MARGPKSSSWSPLEEIQFRGADAPRAVTDSAAPGSQVYPREKRRSSLPSSAMSTVHASDRPEVGTGGGTVGLNPTPLI